MSRVEHSSRDELEKKISRMEDQLKRSNKKMFGCFNCLLYTLILIVIFVGWIGYVTAKAGIAEVPILTNKLYEPPSPVYVVQPQAIDPLLQQIKVQTAGRFTDEVQEVPVDIVLTEQFLSQELQTRLEEDESIELAQVAVTPTYVEVYVDKDDVIVVMQAVPVIDDGKISLEVINTQIGQLHLPNWLGKLFVSLTLENIGKILTTIVSPIGSLEDLSLEQGEVHVKMLVNYTSQILHAL